MSAIATLSEARKSIIDTDIFVCLCSPAAAHLLHYSPTFVQAVRRAYIPSKYFSTLAQKGRVVRLDSVPTGALVD